MTGTNHALTGANIALITGQWWAVPLSFISHFMLDVLPHYGEDAERGRRFKIVLGIDVLVASILALAMAGAGVLSWFVFLCMIVAWSPDVVHFWREWHFATGRATPETMPQNWLTSFHKKLQWGERTWGWVLEISWFIAMISVMALTIRS